MKCVETTTTFAINIVFDFSKKGNILSSSAKFQVQGSSCSMLNALGLIVVDKDDTHEHIQNDIQSMGDFASGEGDIEGSRDLQGRIGLDRYLEGDLEGDLERSGT